MMGLPSDSSFSSSRELAQRSYNQALELENQLRVLIQSKGPFDTNVRTLQSNIRESYEAIILEDHEFSELHDVEQALWRLHYKRIEEFRARIRKTIMAGAATSPAPPVPSAGSRVAQRKEPLRKLHAFFKSFLSEATGFYHDLIMKIRGKYGISQEYASFQGELHWPLDEKGSAELKRCQLSCHRCLIFLGDLARYKELHSEGGGRSHDWSVATGYYLKAASLWPSSGNPHNQLAVLATYVGDELLAVHQYFRSLAVESPFLTARENLVVLFEKNRQHYTQLSSLVAGTVLPLSKTDVLKASENVEMVPTCKDCDEVEKQETDLCSTAATIAETRKTFRVRFVRLNGILFTRTSLETFPEVYSATMRDMEQLLSFADSSLEAGLGLAHCNGIGGGIGWAVGAVQLVSVLIFSVHNVNWGLDAHQPTYAEILQRSALFQHAFTAAFECAARLMRRCAEAKDVSASPLLPALLIFLEWLACRPEMAVGSEMDEKQANARSFFWKQSVTLLNILSEKEKGHSDLKGSYDSVSLGFSNETRDDCGLALWEDFELRGFIPLVPAQLTLDYSRQPSRAGLCDKEERQVRVQRILGAGKAVANALEDSGRGICFDDDLELFFIAGENREREIKDGPINSLKKDDVAVTSKDIVTTDMSPAAVQFTNQNLSNGLAKAAAQRNQSSENQNVPSSNLSGGEEEEELIVFKPVLNVNKPFPQPFKPDWLHQKSLCTSNNLSNMLESSSFQEDFKYDVSAPQAAISRATGSNLGNFTTDSYVSRSGVSYINPTNPAICFQASVNGYTLPSSMVSSGPNDPKSTVVEDDNLVKSTLLGSVSRAGKWVNLLSGSSAYPSSSTTPWGVPCGSIMSASDPDKLSSHAAIAWHSKQAVVGHPLWSSELESLARSGLEGSDHNARNYGWTDGAGTKAVAGGSSTIVAIPDQVIGKEHMPISSSLGSLTSSFPRKVYPSLPATANFNLPNSVGHHNVEASTALPSVVISEMVRSLNLEAQAAGSGNAGLTKNIPSGADTHGTAGSNNSNGSLVRSMGIRPPPGFGPLPTAKPTTKMVMEHHQGSSQLPESITVREREEQHEVDDYRWLDDYTATRPITIEREYPFSSSLGYGIWSPLPSSEAVAYPFPGMGSSHHRAQQTSLEQFQCQLLKQQQTDAQQLHLGVQKQQQQQQQHLLLLQQQWQQQQQQQKQQQPSWFGQYRSQDPFVS
ncbi:hypothetical protein O6H91_23G016400 [Diphasiastrum complanatum]|uniref:Uncharacterized protein n=12 Tax=Diphasiastrum complanatum TaxID=34168 RepID=A0ACC2A8F5_DIPCM|nr:hypothetical protein O6H91_23G016400 [Diphasiastrum complanatum]KAJ7513838.1 hypothetical protein O6H91_23G016400 [Diphasiastrum complanatum]KAJ7513839.1 hypothetical protein O6H91_23G016400 [Diphasiastrum complanatum]KAJ7513840.1 hypothetical protein O6H91_23G016400 [Diphasiastrum complanatum]KAJ7513841.1 hypothetical protein O6H91_23G016400 [Diphasiastrum complanatum]